MYISVYNIIYIYIYIYTLINCGVLNYTPHFFFFIIDIQINHIVKYSLLPTIVHLSFLSFRFSKFILRLEAFSVWSTNNKTLLHKIDVISGTYELPSLLNVQSNVTGNFLQDFLFFSLITLRKITNTHSILYIYIYIYIYILYIYIYIPYDTVYSLFIVNFLTFYFVTIQNLVIYRVK